MPEVVDQRVLGALRFTDGVTASAINRPLSVEAPHLTLLRNRDGLYVILSAAGLGTHTQAFDTPPAAPAAESLSFDLTVADPRGEFLPTRATIALPRPFDLPGGITTLLEPIDVALASNPGRTASSAWAVVRAAVLDENSDPLPGALVTVAPSGGGNALGWGLTNRQGEAMVAVAGLPALVDVVPITPGGDTELAIAETSVTVSARADTARPFPANPVQLTAGGPTVRTSAAAVPATLTPGRTQTLSITVDLS
ncbi:MAG: hypothetical protein AAF580_06815 [Pseudomonadota bacterium]